jgi:hypothetical protein
MMVVFAPGQWLAEDSGGSRGNRLVGTTMSGRRAHGPAAGSWTQQARSKCVRPDQDLLLKPADGIAPVTQDDKQTTYDLTGPGHSNFTP